MSRLRNVVAGSDWVAVDTETTGLGPRAEIVELAIVGPEGLRFESLVRPRGEVSRGAARVHGIDPAALRAAPAFASVADEVRRQLAKRTVLGYNVDFDRRLLWRELAAAGRPAPACRWLCLCDLLTSLAGRRLALGQALAALGLDPAQAGHRAAADATAVAALARALAAPSSLDPF